MAALALTALTASAYAALHPTRLDVNALRSAARATVPRAQLQPGSGDQGTEQTPMSSSARTDRFAAQRKRYDFDAPREQPAAPTGSPAPRKRVGDFGPPRQQQAASAAPIALQGGALRTWSFRSGNVEQVQVVLSSEGRPLDGDIELWHGPDNVPVHIKTYSDDGRLRPFSTVIETPRGPSTVAIRNVGNMEFPIAARCFAEGVEQVSDKCLASCATIQGGGALRTAQRWRFLGCVLVSCVLVSCAGSSGGGGGGGGLAPADEAEGVLPAR